MAEMHVTLKGKMVQSGDEVTIVGSMWYTDLGIWSEPILPPPIAQPPGDPKARWILTNDGWAFVVGPLDKPRPLPPELSGGKWTATPAGWFFVYVTGDKPRPPGAIGPPGVIPEPPSPPREPSGRWVLTNSGWAFVFGPLDRPRPMPPELEGGQWASTGDGWWYVYVTGDKPRPPGEIGPPGTPIEPPTVTPPEDLPAQTSWMVYYSPVAGAYIYFPVGQAQASPTP